MGGINMKLVYGVGINDADYRVTRYQDNKQIWMCPMYRVWKNVLQRCFSSSFQEKWPTYKGCTIDPAWLVFSAFKSWMTTKNWDKNHIDKDLLVPGNKRYGPDTCVFLSAGLNLFLTEHGAARGEHPVGVSRYKRGDNFSAKCSNPFTGGQGYLGVFKCPNQAHLAWAAKKLEYAKALAALQVDTSVGDALVSRFTAKHETAKQAIQPTLTGGE